MPSGAPNMFQRLPAQVPFCGHAELGEKRPHRVGLHDAGRVSMMLGQVRTWFVSAKAGLVFF
eukprot:2654043-Lingulodinium_polyedra.AAC.1